MDKSGQITVFLSLALLCIFSLMCGLIESARTAGARCYLKLAADSAMDSVFSQYHREVWDKYRLFLLEFKDEGEIYDNWKKYMEPYMESSGWYSMDMVSADKKELIRITDNGGEHLNQEIKDYMKFGIFKDLPDAEGANNLMESLKQASAVGKLSRSFSGHTKEVVRLEQVVADINQSLKEQKDCWQRALQRLNQYDGNGFRKEADRLEKEMEKLSKFVRNYKRTADQLQAGLKDTHNINAELSGDLSPEISKNLYEDTSSYESYVSQEGQRRIEIENLPEKMAVMKSVIVRARDRAAEVEEMIDNWESDEDEDDEPDYSGLWGSVENIWSGLEIPVFSYSNGVKDPEKQRILEKIIGLSGNGFLTLVLPEDATVSKGVITESLLPSGKFSEKEDTGESLLDRILFEEYCSRFLTNFQSDEEKEVQYEMEYLISGLRSDEENLRQAVTDILAVREGLNFVHILSDSEKRQEAKTLAGVITGVTGMTPLTGVIAFFIMTVWAFGETIVDLRMLLRGEKVVLLKTSDNWNLSLSNLMEMGNQDKGFGGKGGDKGVNYMGYLKLLLFIKDSQMQRYRLMDVIQWNISMQQAGFRMEDCIYQAEISGVIKSKHLFFGGSAPFYSIEVRTEKAY
ncbi:DUF5702 domain-containing protein [Clostridium sp. HBUAS56010]|uniref:DUF5702 domain-containing protein n=1 Tax=Clostridium sp. HBUAS56010 TaxID=2571127 RepID=UPI0011785D1A|nr:DUF5702 domain-containing protein [Clostridium sp. HBUAS56010]